MNFYEILHIAENAPDEIIKLAYKGLAQKYHPDRYKGADANEKMVQIREAYEVLSNPTKRKEYDNYLKNLRFNQKAKENQAKQNYQKSEQTHQKPKENQTKQTNKTATKNDFEQAKEEAKKKYIKKEKFKKYISFFILAIFIIVVIFALLIQPKEVEPIHSYDENITSEPIEASAPLDSETINSENIEEFNIQPANNPPVIETNITTASQKELLKYNEKLLQEAIQQLFSTYEENGLTGLISNIQECYQQNKNMKYCFYLDYSSRIFDHHMSDSMNSSPYEFFNDETFHSRIFMNYYSKIKVDDVDLVNQQLLIDAEKINELLPKEANKRFSQP